MGEPGGTPLPPLALANRVCSLEGEGDPYAAYEAHGAEAKAALLDLLPDDWSFAGTRCLDFGCGAGRTLRHFLAEAEHAEFVGVDIDAPSIAWLQHHLCPPLRAVHGPTAPPLPLEPRSFDLIWALSVFTHLTDTSLAWIAELHRLLKPGGLLIASYMGRLNHWWFLDEPWDEDRVGMNVLLPTHGWDVGGPMVLMSDWWVREHWGRGFEFVRSADVHGQTWPLLRKRDVVVTGEDLERPGDDPRELRALRHNVEQAVALERRRIAAVRAEYERSLSWRLTRPLRASGRFARSRRPRGGLG